MNHRDNLPDDVAAKMLRKTLEMQEALLVAKDARIAQLQAALNDKLRQPPQSFHDWSKCSPAMAFHYISRHALNWEQTGEMMAAWRAATAGQPGAGDDL